MKHSCAHCYLLLLLGFFIAKVQSQSEGDVRLINRPSRHQGTVAIFHNNAWGTLCDDNWDKVDADVICRQLGFEGAEEVWHQAHYGPGAGNIWVDEIRCPLNGNHILQCIPHVSQWGKHDCSHSEDAGVDCVRNKPAGVTELPVALSCPENKQLGSCKNCSDQAARIEQDCVHRPAVQGIATILHKGQRYPINGQGFGPEEARVVCGELGFPVALGTLTLEELWTNFDGNYCSHLSASSGSSMGLCGSQEVLENDHYRDTLSQVLVLKDLECIGGEGHLADCHFSELKVESSASLQLATVRCGFNLPKSCSSSTSTEVYRLKSSAVPWKGRVEVRMSSGRWAAVCDIGWDHVDAGIVCRALGYGAAKHVHSRSNFGRGIETIAYSKLNCDGTEETLADCTDKATGSAAQSCGHANDAGVECVRPNVCPSAIVAPISRLIDIPVPNSVNDSFVEINGPNGWGFICVDYLNLKSANVICRSSRHQFAANIRSSSLSEAVVRYGGIIECSGSERSISDCGVSLMQTDSCPNGEAILVCRTDLPDLVPDLGATVRSLSRTSFVVPRSIRDLACAIEEGCLSSSADTASSNTGRFLLRFDSLTMNWGNTDFLPNRDRSQWQFHKCHNHFHSFETFINYDLLNPSTGDKAAEGHKASFCLEDSFCVDGGPRYSCKIDQGITTNCGDFYGSDLDCQWIDITDVPSGSYHLRLQVNPDYLVPESDHDNNDITCEIQLVNAASSFRIMRLVGCSIADY